MARHSTTETDADYVCKQCQGDFTMAAFDSVLVQLEYIEITAFKALDELGSDAELLGKVNDAQDYLDRIRHAIEFAPRAGE
jgi:hypothetical protein